MDRAGHGQSGGGQGDWPVGERAVGMVRLLEMARALGATCDLDTLLPMVVSHSMALLGAERATLFLYDGARQELYTRVAAGVEGFRIPLSTGLAGAAARSLEVINAPDAYADARFNRSIDERTGYHTRGILSCPLIDYDGQLVGVLQVLNKRRGTFGAEDVALAEALGAQAGVALQRAHLLQEHLEKQRLEQSLAIAKDIQQKLLPREAPRLEHFDVACWHRACDAIGGDYCDFLRLRDGRMLVSFGDVSGHGVGPALVSCATRAMLRALASINDDIEGVMRTVNVLMTEDLPDNRFVTALIGVLDDERGELAYCSAGQAPLLWVHGADGAVDVLAADGIPVGILSDYERFPQQRIALAAGDLFVLLTDGFYEWADGEGRQFGIERVIEICRRERAGTASAVLEAIRAAVTSFGETKQADDLTAILIKRTG